MSLTPAFDNYVLNPKKFPVIYYLFDDRAIDAYLKKLQGAIEAPSPPRRDRRTPPRKEPTSMFAGVVKMFSERGCGFISRDDGGTDVFVHVSEVTKAGLRSLQPGDRVAFNLVAGKAGRTQAADIRVIDQVKAA